MSRFDGWDRPKTSIEDSPRMIDDWASYKDRRQAADGDIIAWADRATEADLDGDLHWFSPMLGREVGRPKWLLITHFFNHQTHHRGQVHAMLTAAGATTGPTDLGFMPDDQWH